MKSFLKNKFSRRQYELARMLSYEWKRWRCRVSAPRQFQTNKTKMHLGCGDRRLEGWLNIDLFESDLNLDIANGYLPFADNHFETIVSQHVVEHLTIQDELIPLLRECHRCMKPGAKFWISTPDMRKVSKSYMDFQCKDMVIDREGRLPDWNLDGLPSQHFMNDMFHQQLEHRNLFDFELLEWVLHEAGFEKVERVNEAKLILNYPEFPQRKDDYQSLYVVTYKS